MKAQQRTSLVHTATVGGKGETVSSVRRAVRIRCRLAMCAVAELPCHTSRPSTLSDRPSRRRRCPLRSCRLERTCPRSTSRWPEAERTSAVWEARCRTRKDRKSCLALRVLKYRTKATRRHTLGRRRSGVGEVTRGWPWVQRETPAGCDTDAGGGASVWVAPRRVSEWSADADAGVRVSLSGQICSFGVDWQPSHPSHH